MEPRGLELGIVGTNKNENWRSRIESAVMKSSSIEACAAMSTSSIVLLMIQTEMEKYLLREVEEL